MSNAGLQAGLYAEIRSLSVLVDAVIADISSGPHRPSQARSELSQRLRHITSGGSAAHLLRYMLPGMEFSMHNWSSLPGALDQTPAPPDLMERLETMARVLDRSRSAAFERLRGVDAR